MLPDGWLAIAASIVITTTPGELPGSCAPSTAMETTASYAFTPIMGTNPSPLASSPPGVPTMGAPPSPNDEKELSA
jgi:hypothetical protein